MSKLPAFSFYPGDWMKDPNLKRCTHAAKGVLIDLLCVMFECEERGVLISAGKPWSDDEAVVSVGGHSDVTALSLRELTEKGVLRRRNDGALYSARMVRDEERRKLDRERQQKSRENRNTVGCHANVTGSVTPPVTDTSQPLSVSSSVSSSDPKPPKPPRGRDGVPAGKLSPEEQALMFRVRSWFRRKYAEVYDEKDVRALRKVMLFKTPPEDVDLLENYYRSTVPHGCKDYRRKDLPTLLNNWEGEIDRARQGFSKDNTSNDLRVKAIETAIRNHPANSDGPRWNIESTEIDRKDLRGLREKLRLVMDELAGRSR